MSDNAGCAWVFGLAVVGVLGFLWLAAGNNNALWSMEQERYRICIENGGAWDGFWKSCSK